MHCTELKNNREILESNCHNSARYLINYAAYVTESFFSFVFILFCYTLIFKVGNLRRRRRLDSENDSENDSEDDADNSEFANGDFEDSDSDLEDLEKDPNAGSSDEDDENDDFIEDSDDCKLILR